MHPVKIDQSDIQTGVDSKEQVDGILVLEIVETALEKLDDHVRRDSSETDASNRSRGISENF